MKTIITVFLLFLISASAVAMEGFHKGDTVRYKFDKMLIEVTSTNALQKGIAMKSNVERIKQIQEILKEIEIAPPDEDERVSISFKEMDDDLYVWNYKEVELNRTKISTKKLVVFEDGTTFEKDFGSYCITFSFKAVETKIYLNDLADLSRIIENDFEEQAERALVFMDNKFGEKYRKGIHAWLDLREDEVKGHFQDVSYKTNDMIILSAGIGSGWVKNTFVSDVNFRLGFTFGNKGMFKNTYAIDYSMMYDFSESNDNKFYELNHFLSVSWQHNFSNTPDENKWYGFSFGYLINRNNNFFKDNTFKIGINKKINDTFSVKPELYFNDFFKNVHPGIRLSVAF